jgi:stearoyl-CoA desaturase (delta-9 desaturase)
MLEKISKSFWFQFLPLVIAGIIAVILLTLGIIPLYYLFFTFLFWVLIAGLGVAVGYHRVFSHKTHKLPTWKENILLLLGTLSGQGPSIFWVAVHRGYHHPHSDTEKDIHSPITKGKFHAFLGWQLLITEEKNYVNLKYSVDLMRKKNHLWFFKNHIKILWAVPLLIAIFDWKLALAGLCLASAIAVVQDNLVNVYGHWKTIFSYRNFDTADKSQNHLLLGYLTWGQNWHNNHHYDPKSYDFGTGVSGKWWEWDPCKLFLPFLK